MSPAAPTPTCTVQGAPPQQPVHTTSSSHSIGNRAHHQATLQPGWFQYGPASSNSHYTSPLQHEYHADQASSGRQQPGHPTDMGTSIQNSHGLQTTVHPTRQSAHESGPIEAPDMHYLLQRIRNLEERVEIDRVRNESLIPTLWESYNEFKKDSTTIMDHESRLRAMEANPLSSLLDKRFEQHDQLSKLTTANVADHESRLRAMECNPLSMLLDKRFEQHDEWSKLTTANATAYQQRITDLVDSLKEAQSTFAHRADILEHNNKRLDTLVTNHYEEMKANAMAAKKRCEMNFERSDNLTSAVSGRVSQLESTAGKAVTEQRLSTLEERICHSSKEQDLRIHERLDKLDTECVRTTSLDAVISEKETRDRQVSEMEKTMTSLRDQVQSHTLDLEKQLTSIAAASSQHIHQQINDVKEELKTLGESVSSLQTDGQMYKSLDDRLTTINEAHKQLDAKLEEVKKNDSERHEEIRLEAKSDNDRLTKDLADSRVESCRSVERLTSFRKQANDGFSRQAAEFTELWGFIRDLQSPQRISTSDLIGLLESRVSTAPLPEEQAPKITSLTRSLIAAMMKQGMTPPFDMHVAEHERGRRREEREARVAEDSQQMLDQPSEVQSSEAAFSSLSPATTNSASMAAPNAPADHRSIDEEDVSANVVGTTGGAEETMSVYDFDYESDEAEETATPRRFSSRVRKPKRHFEEEMGGPIERRPEQNRKKARVS